MLHQTTILGALGKDAEVRHANDKFVISFSIASSLRWKVGEEWKEKTFWTECDMWFKKEDSANALADALRKGTRVVVSGQAYARAWLKNGEPMPQLCLRVENLEIAHSTKVRQEQQNPTAPPIDLDNGEDDLPF